MAQWHSSESGILRKNKKKDNFEDLLVFGYACKIFRDDEKALHIDQGKHLIPWMGDEKLKVDRYDCRGHLTDLNRYEANREGYDTMRWLGLDENERKLEQLCDQERYYSLRNNEEEEQMYKEEEEKRNKTNAFQYSYDVPTNPETQEGIPTVPEFDEDEEYVPPPELDVPVDISIPKTVKENARIEKTAMFVSTQGPQMEILIKAKQNDNPQFGFLNQNDPLYKFYRHVLNAIKNGRYQIRGTNNDQTAASNSSNTSGGESGDHYLHPSLVSSANSNTEQPLPTTTIPSVPYKPSANCAYSQLVNRIQGSTNVSKGQTDTKESADAGQKEQCDGNFTYEQQQQYYQYYMQQQYYEYYKHMAQNSGTGDELTVPIEKPMDANMQAYIQQMMYAHYLQQTQQPSTNPYAQIVSNVSKDATSAAGVANKPDMNQESTKVCEETTKKSSVLSLIQNYGSDSEYSESDDDDLKIPEDETKVVIDKMASYVIKNGSDFENIVKSRADPRFEFLNENHEFYKYYRRKINEEKKKKECEENEKSNKSKEKKIIAPVSFSIKKPKDEHPKEIKSALPIDEDTDDEEQNKVQESSTQPNTSVNCSRLVYKEEVDVKQNEVKNHSDDTREIVVEKDETDVKEQNEETPKMNGQTNTTPDDPILEMIDLTEDILDDKTEKFDDVDTIESKEKMGVKENRALQLERRRKAMAFLKMKSTKVLSDGSILADNVPTIDLSDVSSPKRNNDNSDNEREKSKSRSERHKHKKSRRESRKDRERSRNRRSPKREASEGEVDYSSSSSDENVKHRKSSHRKKRSHKRKHSKSSRGKSRKKSKKRDKSSSSNDSDK